jgi:hypothetical protein
MEATAKRMADPEEKELQDLLRAIDVMGARIARDFRSGQEEERRLGNEIARLTEQREEALDQVKRIKESADNMIRMWKSNVPSDTPMPKWMEYFVPPRPRELKEK